MLHTEEKNMRLNQIYFWIRLLSTIIFILWLLYLMATIQCIQNRGKIILLWNNEFGTEEVKVNSLWNNTACGCIVTTDRAYRKHKINAIVFNGNEPFNITGLSNVHKSKRYLAVYMVTKPFSELPEPPTYNGVALYNATMSYRQDSDLVVPDYFIAERGTHKAVTKFKEPDLNFMVHVSLFERITINKILALKKDLAVYYMYPINTQTTSKSMLLSEMRRFFDLDAIIECSNVARCFQYKFMLVFESAQCSDYIRPEFFIALKLYIVPVVHGDADYSLYAPPMSYINVKDYSSISDLAARLRNLSKNEEEYKKYFWWHSEYSVLQIAKPLCYLCSILNKPKPNSLRHYNSDGYDFLNWWSKNNCTRK